MKTISKILDFVKKVDLPYCSEADHFNYPLTDIGLYSTCSTEQRFANQSDSQLKKKEQYCLDCETTKGKSEESTKSDFEFRIFCPICRYNKEQQQKNEEKPFDILPIKIFLRTIIESLNSQLQKKESESQDFIFHIKSQIKDVKTIRKICQLIEQKLKETLNSYQNMVQIREKSELFVEDILCRMLSSKKCNSETLKEQLEALKKECAVLFSDYSSTYQIVLKNEENKNKFLFCQQIQQMLDHSSSMIRNIQDSLEFNLPYFNQMEILQPLFDQIKVENEEVVAQLQHFQLHDDKANQLQLSFQQGEMSTAATTANSSNIFKEDLNKFEYLNKQTENYILNLSISSKENINQQIFSTTQKKPLIYINDIKQAEQLNQP